MITRKSAREIEIMKKAGAIVANAHQLVQSLVKPGATAEQINKEVEKFILKNDAIPVFKGYRGFPASICASLNEEIVHGIPDGRKLREGDILSVDIGVRYQGYIGDSAKTFPVGKISEEASKLLKVCQECLDLGIKAAIPGNKISDIARSVQTHAQAHGYGIVREYTGHGIGTEMHEEPQIPNYIDKSWMHSFDVKLKPGYCIAIEPMLNLGTHRTKTVRRQNWDVVLTKDNKISAHFEHSVAISEDGPIILTLPD